MKNRKIFQEITDKIISLLETHLIWDMPWLTIDQNGMLAHNATSKTVYNGVNQLLLSLEASSKGFIKNSWMTFNQIRNNGGKVLKGQKSSPVYFFSIIYFEKGKFISEDIVKKLSASETEKREIKKVHLLKFFPVFNVFQTEGLPEKFYEVKIPIGLTDFQKNQLAEEFIDSSGAIIHQKLSNRAYYSPSTDSITLPLHSQFKSEESFYDVALHELGHWTGHPTRMNRDLFNRLGSENYAFEELVAELFSTFACAELGFSKTITNNAAYIKSWITALKYDTSLIFKASKQAEKALGFVKEH